jgi:hypothetical protein
MSMKVEDMGCRHKFKGPRARNSNCHEQKSIDGPDQICAARADVLSGSMHTWQYSTLSRTSKRKLDELSQSNGAWSDMRIK